MTHLSASAIEHLSPHQLRLLQTEILDQLIQSGKTLEECPLTALTLANIRKALQRGKPRGPGM